MDILQNFSLKNYNTFGINASTQYWIEAASLDDIKEGLTFSRDKRLLILGGGSNLLLLKDWDSLVLHVNNKGIQKVSEDNEFNYIKAEAGEVWHELVQYCISNNYPGIENLSLIPGNVGASPMQNIGAYGVELKDVFYELEAINIHDLSIARFSNNDCEFGYRSSVFKTKARNKYIILNVTFKFPKKYQINTSYGAIEEQLTQMKVSNPTIKDVSDAVIKIRSSKLPDPKEIGNAGSFFKNPVVDEHKYKDLLSKYPELPAYSQPDGKVKLAAGWLIEQAGWKGKTFKEFGVHKNQALVLVNYGNASGKDIYNLSESILTDIKEKFGITLEREVNIIG